MGCIEAISAIEADWASAPMYTIKVLQTKVSGPPLYRANHMFLNDGCAQCPFLAMPNGTCDFTYIAMVSHVDMNVSEKAKIWAKPNSLCPMLLS